VKRDLALLLLLIMPWCAQTNLASAASLSQQDQNKAIARRVFDEIFSQGKFEVANQIYAGDFVNHGFHRDATLAEDQAAQRFEKQACPDLKMTVGPMVAEGDMVSVLWTARGTNTVRVGWLPATGAKIELRGITIWRIADGKIREEWSSFNDMTVIREVAYQLRWLLIGLSFALLLVLWLAYRMIGALVLRMFAHARA